MQETYFQGEINLTVAAIISNQNKKVKFECEQTIYTQKDNTHAHKRGDNRNCLFTLKLSNVKEISITTKQFTAFSKETLTITRRMASYAPSRKSSAEATDQLHRSIRKYKHKRDGEIVLLLRIGFQLQLALLRIHFLRNQTFRPPF